MVVLDHFQSLDLGIEVVAEVVHILSLSVEGVVVHHIAKVDKMLLKVMIVQSHGRLEIVEYYRVVVDVEEENVEAMTSSSVMAIREQYL